MAKENKKTEEVKEPKPGFEFEYRIIKDGKTLDVKKYSAEGDEYSASEKAMKEAVKSNEGFEVEFTGNFKKI
jgi:hypothetical protein